MRETRNRIFHFALIFAKRHNVDAISYMESMRELLNADIDENEKEIDATLLNEVKHAVSSDKAQAHGAE